MSEKKKYEKLYSSYERWSWKFIYILYRERTFFILMEKCIKSWMLYESSEWKQQ